MKFTTAQSDDALTLNTRRNVIYGEAKKADSRDEIEMKIVRTTDPATSTTMTALTARITMRNDITNADIGTTIGPTVNAMGMTCMSTTGEERKSGGTVGQGVDLDRARHRQTENIISVTIGHTAQLDLPHWQPQSVTDIIALQQE